MLFCISDPDVQQDPAFPCCCLTKWSLQELFTVAHYSQISNTSFQHKLDA